MMKVKKFSNDDAGRLEWLEARRGRMTGSLVATVFSKRDKKYLKGYYEIIADRIALPPSDENRMDRGLRLEDEAMARFAKETGKKVNTDLVLCYREDNENIANSPDGLIGKTEAVEVKCLNSASHIQAYLTKKIPGEYLGQMLQYFVVNDNLRKLYFVFYDPRMPKDFFYLEVSRKEVEKEVAEYLELEHKMLAEIEKITNELTF